MSLSRPGNQRLKAILTDPKTWARNLATTASLMLIWAFHPITSLLGWPESGKTIHTWPDTLAWLVLAIGGQALWRHHYRRNQSRADKEQLRADLLNGRLKRISFGSRVFGLLGCLTLVVCGETFRHAGRTTDTTLLLLAWMAFLFFILQETVMLIKPGESLLPDPNDELLAFLRGRALAVGFAAAILGLVAMSLLALLRSDLLALVMPVCLTVSVLVPAWRLHRLEKEADAAG